jgi:hypothetical protein
MKTSIKPSFEQRLSLCLALLLGIFAATASGQTTTGSIYGTVSDPSGAVIPNAAVTATNTQNNFSSTAQSNETGDYVFPVLAPGSYTVSAQAKGFKTTEQTGIILDANQNVHVIFKLSVGATTETVSVSPSTTLVDTVEAQIAYTVDQTRIEGLPLNGRNALDLVTLAPGVVGASEGQAASGGLIGDVQGETLSMNGLPINQNTFYLDGAYDDSQFRPGGNLPPNPDALQEFRILTSNFDAEFGTQPGAVVNVITRSGTNNFHGLLYDYVRNSIFNARTEFVTGPATHLRWNQFGGNFGGPVLRNKLFGFFSYQGFREATNSVLSAGAATVPTGPNGSGPRNTLGASPGGERNGDFSTDAVIPACGAATYPCPGTPGNPNTTPGIIPAAYLDPVVQNILKFIPIPTTITNPNTGKPDASGGPTAQQVANAPITANEYLGRGDYKLNDKHTLSYMFFHEYGTNPNPTAGGDTVLGYSGNALTGNQTNSIGTDTWTISPKMLNTFRFYYTGNHYAAADLFPGQNLPSALGITAPCGGSPCTQPNVRIAGYIANLGNTGSAPTSYVMTTFGAGDTFNWTLGQHTIKFGWSELRNKYALNGIGNREGVYVISGYATGNPLADFLLGKSASFTQNNSPINNVHMMDTSLFSQDDWKVTRRLTLNLGVRWEIIPPYHGQNNMGSFVPNVQSTVIPTAPTGILFNGDPGVPDGIQQTSYTKFAPRLGFAYDVFGNGTTSVRGGWGLFYSQLSAEVGDVFVSPLFSESITLTDTTNFANPYSGNTPSTSPFPFTPNLKNPTFVAGQSFQSEPPYNKIVPYTMEYNLTVEHQFGSRWAAGISYVGNSSQHYYGARDQNAPIYSSSCTSSGSTACNTSASYLARRPYKPTTTTTYVFNGINEYDPEIEYNYNALQATLTRRFAHGLSINANYVWSKNMGDGLDPTHYGGAIEASSSYDFHYDYGRNIEDQPQRFVVSYVWVSPAINRWGYLGREVLSGWQFSGITTLATGLAINVVSNVDTSYTNNPTPDRPNQIGNPSLGGGRSRSAKIKEFFNTAAFAPVPVGTATGLGNAQFDAIIGPGTKGNSLAASKSFAVWKENKVQFRADAFNLFNNVNLNNPALGENNASTFGTISSASAGRVLQLALKYMF